MNPTYYKSLIGSMRYLICTRSDILFKVGLASRFMEEPKGSHLMAAKMVLQYIKGTIQYDLFYGSTNLQLVGYSDND